MKRFKVFITDLDNLKLIGTFILWFLIVGFIIVYGIEWVSACYPYLGKSILDTPQMCLLSR